MRAPLTLLLATLCHRHGARALCSGRTMAVQLRPTLPQVGREYGGRGDARRRPHRGIRGPRSAHAVMTLEPAEPLGPPVANPHLQTSFDRGLYAQLIATQLLLGLPVLFACGGLQTLVEHGHFDQPGTWLAGALGALPMLALGRAVEVSPSDAVIDINAGTSLFVYQLFGSRARPGLAAAASTAFALTVGATEETLFRGLALPALAAALETVPGVPPLAASASAIAVTSTVFALLHLNPSRTLRASAPERAVAVGVPAAAGVWCAVLAVGASPSAVAMDHLGVAILAHAWYDWGTIVLAHLALTDRYAFTAQAVARDSTASEAYARWARARSPEWAQDVAYCFHYLDLDRSGSLDLRELHVALRSFGLRLSRADTAEWWSRVVAGSPTTLVDDHVALGFDDFARLILRIQDQDGDSTGDDKGAGKGPRPLSARRGASVSPLAKKGLLGIRPMH